MRPPARPAAARLRPGVLLPVLLGAAGVWLLVDALGSGGLARYRLFGVLLGGTLCLPLLATLAFGARARPWLRRVGFALIPVTVLLLLLELLLRCTGFVPPSTGQLLASDRLGHTLAPQPGLADDHGFRNAAVPARADVLFVGDSLTWGFGVAAAAAYPQRFAQISGRAVYNASLGGYGPIQYRELVRRYRQLAPRDVVVGCYLGNDLFDAFRFAHLVSAADLRRDGVDYPPSAPPLGSGRAPNLATRLLDLACANSRLLGFAGGVIRDNLRGLGGLYDAEPGAPGFREGPVATLFAPALCVPRDLGTPAAREGLRLTVACLRDIGADCRQAGARPWLLLLHSKEACYQDWLQAGGRGRDDLAAIAVNEAGLHQALAAAAVAAGMQVIDPTPALLAGLAADRPMWPAGSDPHPGAGGHEVIARAIADALAAAAK